MSKEEYISELKDYLLNKKKEILTPKTNYADYERDLKKYMVLNMRKSNFINVLKNFEESSGYTPIQIYTRAWLSKEVYYGFYHRLDYNPKRETLLALAIGLHLYVEDTKILFQSCGYVFPCTTEDYVVVFFMEKDLYAKGNDVDDYEDLSFVNDLLEAVNCKLLGKKSRENKF